jgi:hypothetical protein
MNGNTLKFNGKSLGFRAIVGRQTHAIANSEKIILVCISSRWQELRVSNEEHDYKITSCHKYRVIKNSLCTW